MMENVVRKSRILVAVVGVAAVACTAGPLRVQAATQGSGLDTLTVTGGSLSVASVGSASFAVTLGSGTVTTAAMR